MSVICRGVDIQRGIWLPKGERKHTTRLSPSLVILNKMSSEGKVVQRKVKVVIFSVLFTPAAVHG